MFFPWVSLTPAGTISKRLYAFWQRAGNVRKCRENTRYSMLLSARTEMLISSFQSVALPTELPVQSCNPLPSLRLGLGELRLGGRFWQLSAFFATAAAASTAQGRKCAARTKSRRFPGATDVVNPVLPSQHLDVRSEDLLALGRLIASQRRNTPHRCAEPVRRRRQSHKLQRCRRSLAPRCGAPPDPWASCPG